MTAQWRGSLAKGICFVCRTTESRPISRSGLLVWPPAVATLELASGMRKNELKRVRLAYFECDAFPPAAPLHFHALTKRSTINSTPTPFFTWAKTVRPTSRIRRASLSITPKSVPTICAKSVLFTTRRSLYVMPGPPFRGILSPQLTSMT